MRKRWIAPAIILAGLTACGFGGGGGGGGGATVASFIGDFRSQMFLLAKPPGILPGLVVADGAGTVIGFNGASVSRQYSVDPDRTLTLFANLPPPPTPFVRGGLSADGNVAGVASVFKGFPPLAAILVRQSSGFVLGDLEGTYHVATYEVDIATAKVTTGWGTATMASGTATFSMNVNSDGSVSTPAPVGGTYAVFSGGETNILLPSGTLTGYLLPGGDLAVCTDVTATDFAVFVLIRAGAGATDATMNGSMFMIGLEQTAAGVSSYTGTAVGDGVGGLSVTLTRMFGTADTVTDLPTEVGTYSVGAGGALTVSLPSRALCGGITPVGRFGVLAGGTAALSDQSWFFFFR